MEPQESSHLAGRRLGVAFVLAALVAISAVGLEVVLPVSASSASPCRGEDVSISQDLSELARARPEGTIFCLAPGIHRLKSFVTPKTAQRFIGLEGAVLNGSVLVDEWTSGEGVWVATEQTMESVPTGRCVSGDACRYSEDVFYDDRLLGQVTSLHELRPGRFFFDYANDSVYIAEDPTGHRVEISATPFAFRGRPGIDQVEIRNLLVEKFANASQNGAIFPDAGTHWIIAGNEIRYNHGTGVSASSYSLVADNYVHHNGQKGVGAMGESIIIENNEISYNNTAGYSPGWDAGGSKFAFTTNLIVRGNLVHHNFGTGLWTDINNIYTLYENNTVRDNWGQGIFHEISYDATIRNNVVRRNGFELGGDWLYGAGILVAHSPNVEVYDNRVVNNYHGIIGIQQDRGTGTYGPWELRNLHVHHNLVKMSRGRTGVGQTINSDEVFTGRNNRFENNMYYLSESRMFNWMRQALHNRAWRSYGNDRRGVFKLSPR